MPYAYAVCLMPYAYQPAEALQLANSFAEGTKAVLQGKEAVLQRAPL
jgi:hypothetical protein